MFQAKLTEKVMSFKGINYPFYTRDLPADSMAAAEVISGDCYGLNGIPDINKFKVVLDIGAHVGSFTCFAKQLYPDTEIYCFEPSPDSFHVLEANTFRLPGVHLFNKAFWFEDGDSIIHVNPGNNGGNTMMEVHKIYGYDDCPPGYTPEPIVKCNPIGLIPHHFDYVKIDCEGCELGVLPHLLEFFDCPWIVGEYHSEQAMNYIESVPNYDKIISGALPIGYFQMFRITE